jgi:hypothetical protein
MTTQKGITPTAVNRPTEAAALATASSNEPGWKPAAVVALTVLEGLMPDGSMQYRLVGGGGLTPDACLAVLHGAAAEFPVPTGWEAGR